MSLRTARTGNLLVVVWFRRESEKYVPDRRGKRNPAFGEAGFPPEKEIPS
jgi:hypothetical protein